MTEIEALSKRLIVLEKAFVDVTDKLNASEARFQLIAKYVDEASRPQISEYKHREILQELAKKLGVGS